MPELPEVQTTVAGLQRVLPGLLVQGVWSDWEKSVKIPNNFNKFKKEIIGRKVLSVERKGKNILISLSGNKTLLVHMKMTGHLMYGEWTPSLGAGGVEIKSWQSSDSTVMGDPKNMFIHFVLNLSDGKQLVLSDLRKFAKILVWPTDGLPELADINKIGPDPLDKNLSFVKFKTLLGKKSNGKIKQVLMNQELVSGIGNIYSDEILFSSKVHPLRRVESLKDSELKKIYNNTKLILKKAILLGGDSMSDYRNIEGGKGKYQDYHKVYKRENKLCLRKGCAGEIQRIKIGGRSACFCPVCQI